MVSRLSHIWFHTIITPWTNITAAQRFALLAGGTLNLSRQAEKTRSQKNTWKAAPYPPVQCTLCSRVMVLGFLSLENNKASRFQYWYSYIVYTESKPIISSPAILSVELLVHDSGLSIILSASNKIWDWLVVASQYISMMILCFHRHKLRKRRPRYFPSGDQLILQQFRLFLPEYFHRLFKSEIVTPSSDIANRPPVGEKTISYPGKLSVGEIIVDQIPLKMSSLNKP